MKRKYECWHCHKTFELEEGSNLECPFCHSDNIDHASRKLHIDKRIYIALLTFVLIIVAFFTYKWYSGNHTDEEEMLIVEGSDSVSVEIEKQYLEETGLDIPPKLEPTIPQVNEDGMYSMTVTVLHAPNTKFVCVLGSKENGKVIAKSEDGAFKDVPAVKNEGGTYELWIEDAVSGKMLVENKMSVAGFVPIEKVAAEMTVEELQKLIDKRDESLMGVGGSKYLMPNYTLHFVGLPSDAVNIPVDLAEVFEKLDNEVWTKVTVVSLEYDNKHISSITIKVKVNNISF